MVFKIFKKLLLSFSTHICSLKEQCQEIDIFLRSQRLLSTLCVCADGFQDLFSMPCIYNLFICVLKFLSYLKMLLKPTLELPSIMQVETGCFQVFRVM
jgi:hypothetical protein